MLVLSKFLSLSKKFISIITPLIEAHYVFSFNNTQTASITIWTIGWGEVYPLISVISFLFILLRAYSASSNIGRAFPN